ncbi:MAG: restriction endonuclease FokI C-terminal domain-containing protein [Solirubrobacteraceae bacterium]
MIPPELAGRELAPEDLFEQVAFRLVTSALRFGGERFGESRRGERLPDAVLRWPGSQRLVALLDCKATSSGYTMDADHFLRFAHYVERLREDVERDGYELRYMLIVSSSFPGAPGRATRSSRVQQPCASRRACNSSTCEPRTSHASLRSSRVRACRLPNAQNSTGRRRSTTASSSPSTSTRW